MVSLGFQPGTNNVACPAVSQDKDLAHALGHPNLRGKGKCTGV